MEPLTYLLIMGVSWIVSYLIDQDNVAAANAANKHLQEDSQEFSSEEAEKQRQWEEDMYLKYKSPSALQEQYSKLGASDTASIMAAMGVSPNIGSGASASTGMNSGFMAGNGMNDMFSNMQKAINSYFENENTQANTNNTNKNTDWIDRLNQNTIDMAIGNLNVNQSRLGLDKDIFENVTIPLANSSINKNKAEIDKMEQEVNESIQRIQNLQEQIRLWQTEEGVNFSTIRLNNAKTVTEEFTQANLAANTTLAYNEAGKVHSETTGINFENQIKEITTNLSKELGMDVRLDWKNNTFMMSVADGDRFLEYAVPELQKAVSATTDALNSALEGENLYQKAYHHGKKFFDKNFKDSVKYRKNGESYLKAATNYVFNRN